MCQNHTDSAGQSVIIDLPGRITKNRCTKCEKDLSYLFADIRNRSIDPPEHCPACGSPLAGRITEIVWRCGHCDERIVDPVKQKSCTKCGKNLNFSPPENTPEE
ncbi:MAG: hypothetical protein CMI53_00520 [Parcubacteria group bacterium]|nr:hypothetical protein [Parcubacteria group bacterium]|tara:strand:+ start:2260 stop:2571 length:312 start_codon:yes stop_codon:yes gene_type:complete